MRKGHHSSAGNDFAGWIMLVIAILLFGLLLSTRRMNTRNDPDVFHEVFHEHTIEETNDEIRGRDNN